MRFMSDFVYKMSKLILNHEGIFDTLQGIDFISHHTNRKWVILSPSVAWYSWNFTGHWLWWHAHSYTLVLPTSVILSAILLLGCSLDSCQNCYSCWLWWLWYPHVQSHNLVHCQHLATERMVYWLLCWVIFLWPLLTTLRSYFSSLYSTLGYRQSTVFFHHTANLTCLRHFLLYNRRISSCLSTQARLQSTSTIDSG